MKRYLLLLLFLLLLPFCASAYSVGFISDIHAGTRKIRDMGHGNIIYPNLGLQYFKSALAEIKTDTTIVTGDLTDDKPKYEHQPRPAAIGRDVIFLRGNHDQKASLLY